MEEDYLRKNHPEVQIKGFPAIPAERAAPLSGQVDGWLASGPMADSTATADSTMRVGERIGLGAENAFPVAKENQALMTAINRQMDAMFADGRYEKLFASYFHRPVPDGLRAAHPGSASPSPGTGGRS
ncbi:transporter substrate-binding domain-containing protein [Streptomyces erythrochromogenes]|uniref:substrate-binding periplasmic protein n=1 Tax=Streptomyces erythrochromogenes TaxID=285574 RepID=UPI0034192EEA